MKKIVITAANSFIGKYLCKALLKKDYYIYSVIRHCDKEDDLFVNSEKMNVIHCDMDEYINLPNLISDKVDIGVDLAWNGTRGKDRDDAIKQNENYHYSVDCIKSFLALECNTIVTAGSQAEYGPQNSGEKVRETDQCNPNTEYGKAKYKLYKTAESICMGKARLIEPRFFSLYGVDDFDGTMIVSILDNMIDNSDCNLTKCAQIWDFLYIDDAIDALIKLIENDKANGVYNFGSGNSFPLKHYIDIMCKETNSKSQINYGAVSYPDTGIVHTNPSVQKIENTIDWKPSVSFSDGIKKVIRWRVEKNEKN